MNRLRKFLDRSDRLSVTAVKSELKSKTAADRSQGEGRHFTSIEDAKTWIGQNRKGISRLDYVAEDLAESYPEPFLTPEQGLSVLANPRLEPSLLRYGRLQSRAIRLLVLEPGNGLETICCRLEEVILGSAAAYDALSYAWGEPTPRYRIMCNGAAKFVAPSIHRALWQFRELGLLGPLWIDVVCINQVDLEEKTEQVKLMRSVYEKAALVRIWLGQASHDTEKAVVLLTRAYQVLTAKQKYPDPPETYTSITSLGLGDVALDEIALLWFFYGQDWFDRSWVVQELAVARKAIFQMGIFEIEAEIMLTVANALSKTLHRGFAMEASTPWAKIESLKPYLFPASVFADVKQRYLSGQRLQLSELVRCTAQLKATEPHDKIFAFVGIASDGDISMVNYHTPIRDLHLTIARNALLSHNGKARIDGTDYLSQVRTYLDSREPVIEEPQKIRQLGLDCPLNEQNLPSWAPDLTYWNILLQDSVVPLASIFPSSSATLTTVPEIRFLDNEIIAVRGKFLDYAQTFFESLPYRAPVRFTPTKSVADVVLQQLAKWPFDCSAFVEKHGLFTHEGGPFTYLTFTRTLVFESAFGDNQTQVSLDWRYLKAYQAWCVVLGLVAKGHRSNISGTDLFEAAAKTVNDGFGKTFARGGEANGEQNAPRTPDIMAAEVLSYATTFDRLARGRKFGFTRRKGLIGWFPECTRNGDVVFLFDGSRLPIVLRHDQDKDAFKIVGDCCPHWFMENFVFNVFEADLDGVQSGFIKIC